MRDELSSETNNTTMCSHLRQLLPGPRPPPHENNSARRSSVDLYAKCKVDLPLPSSVVHRSRRVWRSGISFTNDQRSVKACNVHNAIETPPSSKTSQAWAERSQVLFGCSCSDKVCDCAGFCGLNASASLGGLREIFWRCSGFHDLTCYGTDRLTLLPSVIELSAENL